VVMFWVAILAVSILLYVLLDGFDLGIGILFGLTSNEERRRAMLSAVAPIWDGNETWLVVTAVVLWGAFPVVYATLFSAFYLPLLLMLPPGRSAVLHGRADFRGSVRNTRDLVLALHDSILDHDRRRRRTALQSRLHVLGRGSFRLPADAALHRDQLHRLPRQGQVFREALLDVSMRLWERRPFDEVCNNPSNAGGAGPGRLVSAAQKG
jgi:Cytochrome bd terminal oxidase subunit II